HCCNSRLARAAFRTSDRRGSGVGRDSVIDRKLRIVTYLIAGNPQVDPLQLPYQCRFVTVL
ncbi:MAG: hypothetical protein LPK23_00110, partial [Rhodococcus sp. (in: high G+C Gram-positive bacteria)]|nr:hypothetical protein [Rhodococcus sp. (in: high G+C Gram-positive bacteria)]MDX5451162.1 hypothetical protein [Rhodococcus sp. (in: high G+C Gram-positive bacteria)]